MRESKSPLSKSKSYREVGEFWDDHELSDFWKETREVQFEVAIEEEKNYYSLEKGLAERVQSLARRRGVSPNTLINLWVQEKLRKRTRSRT
ncbi:MAG TPA: CopG family antitoxin [Terriglobia bacterium]|nr:CopG family antitoxin [Terriglobia bacterium]